MPMAAWARATFWASPPPCNASRPPWITRCAASRPSCCRASPTWTTWSRSRTPTAAAWPSTRPAPPIPIRTLRHISLHANLAADPLIVSLGCEKLQPARLFGDELPDPGRSPTSSACRTSAASATWSPPSWPRPKRRLEQLNRRRRVTCPAADLVVGLQCGGSDAFSGVTCNPAVGYAADLLVRAGATVMFSEVTEVRDAIHLLTPRAATPEVARALIREMQWYDDYLAARPGRPQRQHHARQQARRPGQHRREGAGQRGQIGQHGDRARSLPTAKRSRPKGWSSPPRPPAISSAAPSSWPP